MNWQEWCYLCIVILLETKARELGTWDAQAAKFCLASCLAMRTAAWNHGFLRYLFKYAKTISFIWNTVTYMHTFNKNVFNIWNATIYHLHDLHATPQMTKESPSENEHRIERSTYYVVPEITMLARSSSRESPDTRKRTRQASNLLVNQYFTSEFHQRPSSSLIALRTRGLPRHDRKIDYARPVLARWR